MSPQAAIPIFQLECGKGLAQSRCSINTSGMSEGQADGRAMLPRSSQISFS